VFRRIRIHTKLAAALAVPLLALLAVAGFEVHDSSAAAARVRSQTNLAAAAVGPGSLVTRLQDERNRAAIDLIGLGGATELPVDTSEEARTLVDDAVTAFRSQLGGGLRSAGRTFGVAFEELAALEELRADIDAYDGPMDTANTEFADEVFTRYTTIIESFFDAIGSVALNVDDAGLRNGVSLIDAATRQSEMRARLVRDIVLLTLTGKTDSPRGLQGVAALYDRSSGFDADIRSSAVGPYSGIADATFDDAQVQSFNRQVERFLARGEVEITELLASVRSAPDRGYLGLRNRAAASLGEVAGSLHGDADYRRQVFILIALVFIVLGVLVTWAVSRSITEPLQKLTDEAEKMATVRLPTAVQQILDTPAGHDVVIPEVEPIEIRTRDEVGEVATRLNTVQSSALSLAVEQAVLRRNIADSFVNLGRRNQNLLNRQLEVITELERDETDPDALEGLFRVDHLATRMRRNAESLLVLAGIEPPRQWSSPVVIADVVRAALGEVEDYQRVVVRHLDPATIGGAVTADVAHVLAELIENALTFSPPQESVEVRGRRTPTGYTIATIDSGMGMSDEDLARANRRLSGGESFTVAPSRYLGHYVAGHLASRIGLVVELQDSPAGGITARVDIPAELLADGGDTPATMQAIGSPVTEHRPVEAAPAITETALPPPPPPPPSLPAAPAITGTTAAGLPRRAPAHLAAPAAAHVRPDIDDGSDDDEDDVPVNGARFLRVDAEPAAAATENGLARRVPGAQRPDTSVALPVAGPQPARPHEHAQLQPPHPVAGADVPGADPDEVRSSPDDVYAFLSSFRAGVERGLAHARDNQGDQR
jgi:signal transduction histidine kinase